MSRKHKREMRRKQTASPAGSVKCGRKTVLTPEIQSVIVAAARRGTPVSFLGPLAGVRRATVFEWIKKGARPDNPPYSDFADAVKAAQSAFVDEQIGVISEAGKTSWQAKAWLLERMFRDEFGGDKLEINQLKKELRELRALVVQVPRDNAGETAEKAGGEAEGGGDGPADGPAPPG